MADPQEVLERHLELRSLPNVLNVATASKWIDGKDTGIPSIVVYVAKKKSLRALKKVDRVPSEVDGVPVDVIELSSPDFKLGDTATSRLSPGVQRRIAGGVRKGE